MEVVKDYQTLSKLLSAQLRSGVLTNAFFSKECCQRNINAGRLSVECMENSLLLFQQREKYRLMHFYLHSLEDDAVFSALKMDEPIVMEIAYRPKNVRYLEVIEYWKRGGFSVQFERGRLQRKSVDCVEEKVFNDVRMATRIDLDDIFSILEAAYDPIVGCLPLRDELLDDIESGHILCVGEVGAIKGVLQIGVDRAVEIKHITVLERYRHQGIATRLIQSIDKYVPGRRSLVWSQKDNLPAWMVYEKNGYVADGWSSAVLCKF